MFTEPDLEHQERMEQVFLAQKIAKKPYTIVGKLNRLEILLMYQML